MSLIANQAASVSLSVGKNAWAVASPPLNNLKAACDFCAASGLTMPDLFFRRSSGDRLLRLNITMSRGKNSGAGFMT